MNLKENKDKKPMKVFPCDGSIKRSDTLPSKETGGG